MTKPLLIIIYYKLHGLIILQSEPNCYIMYRFISLIRSLKHGPIFRKVYETLLLYYCINNNNVLCNKSQLSQVLTQGLRVERAVFEKMIILSVSTIGSFFTIAFFCTIRITPRANVTVTTMGKPSGMAATAKLKESRKIF